ncbi:MAG TPA: dienelactone hydrolase family protein [Chryseosolibacter sp.]
MFARVKYIAVALFVFTALAPSIAQQNQEKRKRYLKEIIALQDHPASFDSFVSYHDSTWMDWLSRTGELPSDFDALPSIPFLPDPLLIDEGRQNIPVKDMSQWKGQREYFKEQVKHLFCGTFPPAPPKVAGRILEERAEDGVKIQLIELRFGEDPRAKLTIELFTPPGKGPFPVFMSQWNHRGWAQIAVRRGYIGLIYAGADEKDDTRAYLGLYPEYDWSTLMTRAWGAHRAIDYLYTLDKVDKSRIAITGHSRNAKQSLLAAAFDDRITAVISSSGGTGGEFPYRYTDERSPDESIEYLYSRRTHWAHPRIRFYAGREHKLPIDQTSLMALIAPNALLLSSSIREASGDPWAVEQAYQALLPVYKFHGAPDKLGIRLRDGEHAVEARDLESYLDWLDIQFRRKSLPWENKLVYNYTFEKWKDLSNEKIDANDFPLIRTTDHTLLTKDGRKIVTAAEWEQKKSAVIIKDINWIMGEAPAGIKARPIKSLVPAEDYLESFMDRPRVKNGKKLNIAPYNAMGDYLHATLYYPTDEKGKMATRANGKLPVVIFLHKYSNTGFDSESTAYFDKILSKGIAILAMDLIGYGTRIEEGTLFYERYPHWSKLGKMVTDTRAAIDALESLDFIDRSKIFLSGYALGGTVSLFTSALDNRVAATAVSCSFTPWRDDSKEIEGLKAYSHLYGLLPRLGFFAGNEERLPVDFAEIISCIAPRPLMVIAPELDRHANRAKVDQAIEEIGAVYDFMTARNNFEHQSPHEFNQFTAAQQEALASWLEKKAK